MTQEGETVLDVVAAYQSGLECHYGVLLILCNMNLDNCIILIVGCRMFMASHKEMRAHKHSFILGKRKQTDYSFGVTDNEHLGAGVKGKGGQA